jgi:hypothetical protein
MSAASRLARIERMEVGKRRMVVAKLEEGADLNALLVSKGITLRPSDMVVRLTRPDGVGADFAHVVEAR